MSDVRFVQKKSNAEFDFLKSVGDVASAAAPGLLAVGAGLLTAGLVMSMSNKPTPLPTPTPIPKPQSDPKKQVDRSDKTQVKFSCVACHYDINMNTAMLEYEPFYVCGKRGSVALNLTADAQFVASEICNSVEEECCNKEKEGRYFRNGCMAAVDSCSFAGGVGDCSLPFRWGQFTECKEPDVLLGKDTYRVSPPSDPGPPAGSAESPPELPEALTQGVDS
eukprot:GILK01001210.1.p1 GENE.GILK01001210.1~~GILK01001210.1.p1  ORF type:complete len:221 (+),score=56.05 GILK01001210.1:365-1027(+)